MAGELPFPKNERNIVEIRQDIYIREMVKQNAKRIIRCPKDYQENHFMLANQQKMPLQDSLKDLSEDIDFFARTEKRFPVGFKIIHHQIKEAHEKRNLFRFEPVEETIHEARIRF